LKIHTFAGFQHWYLHNIIVKYTFGISVWHLCHIIIYYSSSWTHFSYNTNNIQFKYNKNKNNIWDGFSNTIFSWSVAQIVFFWGGGIILAHEIDTRKKYTQEKFTENPELSSQRTLKDITSILDAAQNSRIFILYISVHSMYVLTVHDKSHNNIVMYNICVSQKSSEAQRHDVYNIITQ